mgnify:FL=1
MNNPYTSFVNMDPSVPTKNAIMFFPQEWDELINCLPLINYYQDKYVTLKVIMRGDSFNMFNFYIKQFDNVEPLYLEKGILDVNFKKYFGLGGVDDRLFFGYNDCYRGDKYSNLYRFHNTRDFSISKLYTLYDIPYSERVNSFSLKRNSKLEDNGFKEVMSSYSGEYTVLDSAYEGSLTTTKTIVLDDDCDIIFDYIKVLEKAKEIYLGDSKWAYMCYLLDSRYGIFRNIKVTILCDKDRSVMFTNPKQLSNWEIKYK